MRMKMPLLDSNLTCTLTHSVFRVQGANSGLCSATHRAPKGAIKLVCTQRRSQLVRQVGWQRSDGGRLGVIWSSVFNTVQKVPTSVRSLVY
jgi:hypothetical protein